MKCHNEISYVCEKCKKPFNRQDSLRRHTLICGTNKKDIICNHCQETFGLKKDLNYHMKSKHKLPVTAVIRKKRRKLSAFRCQACSNGFDSRNDLIRHKLSSHVDFDLDNNYVEPNFPDEELNDIIREHQSLIYLPIKAGDVISTYNLPILSMLGDDEIVKKIWDFLEKILKINTDNTFKINFCAGTILIHKQSGELRYFGPGNNTAFFKKPKLISRPNDLRDIVITSENVLSYAGSNRENTKWTPVMLTNILVSIYHLNVPMGHGKLPDFIKNAHTIVSLDTINKGKKEIYDDGKCAFRTLAYYRNIAANLDGYHLIEKETDKLANKWGKGRLKLEDMNQFELTFGINVDIFTL